MKRLKNILTDIQQELSKSNEKITVGTMVMNNDKECKYYHSIGVVEGIDTFTEPMGLVVAYKTTNAGPNWTAGQVLKKEMKHMVLASDFSNEDSRNTQYNNLPLIAEEEDEAIVGNEFLSMALTALKTISIHAKNIYNSSDDPKVIDNLTEAWVLGKIAVIEDQLRSIRDFVMFSEYEDDDSSDAGSSKPGLWDNIRKKKEREGKKYRPAKPGDKDRPDPEQWNKLTKDNKK
jgi:hypothetical protein